MMSQNPEEDEEITSEEQSQDEGANPTESKDKTSNKKEDGESKNPVKKASAAAASKLAPGTSEKVQEFQQKGSAVATVAGKSLAALKATIAFLATPVGWITVAVLILIPLVVAIVQVIGRNENADGCFGIGGDYSVNDAFGDIDSIISGDLQDMQDEEVLNEIGAFLTSTNFELIGGPFSDEQAAAIVGNIRQESGGGGMSAAIRDEDGRGLDSDSTNEEVRAGIDDGVTAVGLIQWRGDRALGLMDLAEEQNANWNDIDVQLAYLQYELDETEEGNMLLASGFDGSEDDVRELAWLFQDSFERAGYERGEEGAENREDYAEEFYNNFEGGSYSAGSGGGAACATSSSMSSVDGEDIVELAYEMAYEDPEDANVDGDVTGGSVVKEEYEVAKAAVEDATEPDDMELYASCDRFVTTAIRAAFDPEMPWGPTSVQYDYLQNHDDWEEYNSMSDAEPGDVMITQGDGHVAMYLGDVDGENLIAHASYNEWVGRLDNADSFFTEELTDNSNRQYSGFRFTGEPLDIDDTLG